MNITRIFFALIITTLLVGSACAASVNSDFKVDGYSNTYDSDYNSLYLNDNGNSGVYIYKNTNAGHYDYDDDDGYDDGDYDYDDDYDDDGYDDDRYDYDDDYGHYSVDDDAQITRNSDNTASFTDYDDAEHGVTEVVQMGGNSYTVVFWAKDTSSIDNADLMSKLTDFNKDNGVSPIAF